MSASESEFFGWVIYDPTSHKIATHWPTWMTLVAQMLPFHAILSAKLYPLRLNILTISQRHIYQGSRMYNYPAEAFCDKLHLYIMFYCTETMEVSFGNNFNWLMFCHLFVTNRGLWRSLWQSQLTSVWVGRWGEWWRHQLPVESHEQYRPAISCSGGSSIRGTPSTKIQNQNHNP